MRGSSRSMSSRQPVTGTPRDAGETIGSHPAARAARIVSAMMQRSSGRGAAIQSIRLMASPPAPPAPTHTRRIQASHEDSPSAALRSHGCTGRRSACTCRYRSCAGGRPAAVQLGGGSRYRPRRPRKRALVGRAPRRVDASERAGKPDHIAVQAAEINLEDPPVPLAVVRPAAETGVHARTPSRCASRRARSARRTP